MLHYLKRHPIPIRAHFDFALAITYAFPRDLLQPMLPPGLMIDRCGDLGFMAVALVQTRRLRPVLCPAWMGRDFFLAGFRLFVTHRDRAGRTRRGLFILRSLTDKPLMRRLGNLLTHYQYRLANVDVRKIECGLDIDVRAEDGAADLRINADLSGPAASLPEGSPFHDERGARRFAGPMPYTFDYEPQTHSIVRIKGVRDQWNPQMVSVRVLGNTFIERPPFDGAPAILANAFVVRNVEYRWERGVREPLDAMCAKRNEWAHPCAT